VAKTTTTKPRPRRAPTPEVEDDELEIDPSERDFVMARLAAGRSAVTDALTAIDECLGLFVNPDEDKKGTEREALIAAALESLGCASRAVETAEATLDQVDMDECEPWDDGDEDE